jgi:4-hydroxyphenylpyruvate dioxygenase-like putative hemolysin
MRIAAVADRDTGVHVVLAAPRGQSGQVADYLARTGCEGLQHVAFRVKSVRRSLDALARHGLRFIGSTAHRHDAMIEMRQGDRWLRQAFTEPLWGEFFIEIVERRGVSGLLAANMQSLYEMRERRPVSLSGARAPHP